MSTTLTPDAEWFLIACSSMWLKRLDAKASRWPRPVFWAYLALKWYLAALGAFALLRIWADRTGVWPFFP